MKIKFCDVCFLPALNGRYGHFTIILGNEPHELHLCFVHRYLIELLGHRDFLKMISPGGRFSCRCGYSTDDIKAFFRHKEAAEFIRKEAYAKA